MPTIRVRKKGEKDFREVQVERTALHRRPRKPAIITTGSVFGALKKLDAEPDNADEIRRIAANLGLDSDELGVTKRR